ncbi:uncharacterized protein LOC100846009 [Brachypodium distachyon]|uniref:Uncharacterized protein n=1 Tax=Brachypodium distachyon TaxID=15368 RepID=I1I8M2_BRADI|nr:uncharacterized protein LOC100846009 [Brachypodium distachyon]KQJ98995.1 hypothetical protein BRADI_3g40420v3 [Brachypodium distachyon]|eukprot:XP_003572395.1 uncharacterized protein LOC100846009 [Brachypodium distachyon]
MVVLMEYVAPAAGAGVGMATKRKGAEEPGLFACSAGDWDGDGGVPLSCRATKIRRLESADLDAPAVSVGAGHGDDAMMGEELETEQMPAPVAAGGEKAVVLYEPQAGAASSDGGHGIVGLWRRLRPWAAPDWVRDMLREADGRTVRALLSGSGCAQEDDSANAAALAVVPWSSAPAPSASTDQASSSSMAAAETSEEEDAEGAAAMDIEEEEDNPGHQHQTAQTFGPPAGCREGGWSSLYRWPQQQQPAMPLPAVGQARPVTWSW